MKIGIITLPLNPNYGGLLQAFALQKVINQMGHDTLTVNRKSRDMPLSFKILSATNRIIKSIVNRKMGVIRSWATPKEVQIIDQHILRFIRENIRTTHLLKTDKEYKALSRYGFHAYVVGSDQVWRPKYSTSLSNHFVGFVDDNAGVKRVSYAASFGVDNWEYTPEQTHVCKELISKFKAISVREDSAVKLCKEHFGVDALQVLDPTLLLPKEEYIRLVENDAIPANPKALLTYVLDKTTEKRDFIQKITRETGLTEISIMPKSLFMNAGRKGINDCIYPPVTAWLRGFMDAEYVITDSFHGTAFAILFNKPFLALGNTKRGMTRFTSLLKIFGLEDRIITSTDELLTERLYQPIDFSHVNKILDTKRKEAFAFLSEALE